MSLLSSTVSALGGILPDTRADRLLILIYHRVHLKSDPMFPGEVDAARFDWHMEILREHFHPLTLLDAIDGLKRKHLPARAVTVTFDDGYADNATVALPILKRHRVPATFFIAPGYLDGGCMWNDTIIETVRRAPEGAIHTGSIGLGELPLSGPDARGPLAERLIKAVKHLPASRRAALVEDFAARIAAKLPSDLMMTSNQVRELAAAGMEVGAHTMTHPILRTLSDDDARAEIQGSKRALEGIIGGAVRTFAYPNGRPGDDYTGRDRAIVESLGFECALSTLSAAASAGSDRFQLPRFTPWDQTQLRWMARLLLAFGTELPRT